MVSRQSWQHAYRSRLRRESRGLVPKVLGQAMQALCSIAFCLPQEVSPPLGITTDKLGLQRQSRIGREQHPYPVGQGM
jgi:hypothetical protein